MLQKHKHFTYCKRSGRCRFSFPHPPSASTIIAKQGDNDDDIKQASKHLLKVRKFLIEEYVNVTYKRTPAR